MQRQIVALLGTITLAVAVTYFAVTREKPPRRQNVVWSNLSQTYIALNPRVSLRPPPLVSDRGVAFGASDLMGHWSVVFFGFANCPLVCPKTLGILKAAAKKFQNTQVLFVSIDPERDTPAALNTYLAHFDSSFVGVTGTRQATDEFARDMGAGYQGAGKTIDHSTSLFVVDPQGRLAGILLHPASAAGVIADFDRIRQQPAGL